MRNTAESLFHSEEEVEYDIKYLKDTFEKKFNNFSDIEISELAKEVKFLIGHQIQLNYEEGRLSELRQFVSICNKNFLEYGTTENLNAFMDLYKEFTNSIELVYDEILPQELREDIGNIQNFKILVFFYFLYRYYYMINYLKEDEDGSYNYFEEDSLNEKLYYHINNFFQSTDKGEEGIKDMLNILLFTISVLDFTEKQKDKLRNLLIQYIGLQSGEVVDKELSKYFQKQSNILKNLFSKCDNIESLNIDVVNRNEFILLNRMGTLLDNLEAVSKLEGKIDINFFYDDLDTFQKVLQDGEDKFIYLISDNKKFFSEIENYNLGNIYSFYKKGEIYDENTLEVFLKGEKNKFLKSFNKEYRLKIANYFSFDFIESYSENLKVLGTRLFWFVDNGLSDFVKENIDDLSKVEQFSNLYRSFFEYMIWGESIVSYISDSQYEKEMLKDFKNFMQYYINQKNQISYKELDEFFYKKDMFFSEREVDEENFKKSLDFRKNLGLDKYTLDDFLFFSSKIKFKNHSSSEFWNYVFSLDEKKYFYFKVLLRNINNTIYLENDFSSNSKIQGLLELTNFFENIEWYNLDSYESLESLYDDISIKEDINSYKSYLEILLEEFVDTSEILNKIGDDREVLIEFYNFIEVLSTEGLDQKIENNGGDYRLFLEYLLIADSKEEMKVFFSRINYIIGFIKYLDMKCLMDYMFNLSWFENNNNNIFFKLKTSEMNVEEDITVLYNNFLNINYEEYILKNPYQFLFDIVEFLKNGDFNGNLKDILNSQKDFGKVINLEENLSFSFIKQLLPSRDSERVIGFFLSNDFEIIRQNGTSHCILESPRSGKRICVPNGKEDIPLPTLKSIIQPVYNSDIK